MQMKAILGGEVFLVLVLYIIFLMFTYVLPKTADRIKRRTVTFLRWFLLFNLACYCFYVMRYFSDASIGLSIWGYHLAALAGAYSLLAATLSRNGMLFTKSVCRFVVLHICFYLIALGVVTHLELPILYRVGISSIGMSCVLFVALFLVRCPKDRQRTIGEKIFSFSILLSAISLLVTPLIMKFFTPNIGLQFVIANVLNLTSTALIVFGFTVSIIYSLVNRLQEEMNTDSLTKVKNRNYFYDIAARMLAFADRNDIPSSMVISDIDNFKQINDNYGHLVGDLALVKFAESLTKQVRQEDVVIRLGGEEFLVLFPNLPLSQAVDVVERIRAAICEVDIDTGNGVIHMTASFGLVEIDRDRSVDDNISRADKALYSAKNNGKNQVRIG